MPLLQETLDVARSLDEVFAFVGDFANTKDWDSGVAASRKVTEGPVGVGPRGTRSTSCSGAARCR